MDRIKLREMFALNSYWIGLSFMWNSLHVIILPAILLHLIPDRQKNTYLGLLTMVGLLIAMVVQPISGAISDRWRSRWGKRRPLILLGTAGDMLFLALLGWSGGLGWLAVGYIGLQLSSNIAHGPAQGLLPDRVPEKQLGQASGIKNLMDMLGLVISSLFMGRMLKPETRHPIGEVGFIAGVLVLGMLITIFGTRETPTDSRDLQRPLQSTSARIPLDLPKSYLWLIVSRFLFLSAVYGIQTFAQYYIRDVLAVPNPIKLTGDLLAAITLALIFFALLAGWLGDRIGHIFVLVAASMIGSFGCLLLLSARTPATLLLFGGIVGVGIGLFITANWALANKYAPPEAAGRFLGLTNLATAGAGVFGRLEGPVIDFLNNLRPGNWWGYSALFIFGAILMLVSAGFLRQVTYQKTMEAAAKIS
ncbi:MAG TPA: MFS transporter [Anaerolineales bacterium]|nr:MFS transporter [Anaerolineales bacterium]